MTKIFEKEKIQEGGIELGLSTVETEIDAISKLFFHVFYREDPDIDKEEFEVIREIFGDRAVSHLTDQNLRHSLVVGRYSCLPFYKFLQEDLEYIGSSFINNYDQHRFIADLTNWYEVLEDLTPRTWAAPKDLPPNTSFVIKGETNSRKWQWDTHMFAKDKEAAIKIYANLLDDSLIKDQKICFREFVPLKTFFTGINGLPITEEYRFFVMYGKILSGGYYWSNFSEEFPDGPPQPSNVPKEFLDTIIERVKPHTNFFVVDIARTEDDRWIVIELNDGQMSGLSDNDPRVLYGNMRDLLLERAGF